MRKCVWVLCTMHDTFRCLLLEAYRIKCPMFIHIFQSLLRLIFSDLPPPPPPHRSGNYSCILFITSIGTAYSRNICHHVIIPCDFVYVRNKWRLVSSSRHNIEKHNGAYVISYCICGNDFFFLYSSFASFLALCGWCVVLHNIIVKKIFYIL